MIKLRKKLSKEVAEKLKNLGVGVVYFFGSRVDGTALVNSDYDIGVVFRDFKKLENMNFKFYSKVYSVLAEDFPDQVYGPRLDISFLQKANAALQMKAIADGMVLLQNDLAFRVNYEESVFRKYDDYYYLQKEYEDATLSALARR